MKKNIRTLIILIVCVAVLGAGTILVFMLPEGEASDETSSQDAILIYDKSDLIPEQITIKNESGEFTLFGFDYTDYTASSTSSDASTSSTADEYSDSESTEESTEEESENELNVIYTMQEYPNEALSNDVTDELAEQCCYVTALKVVDKSGERYDEYGLDEPRATASIVFSDGSEETLYFGNDAPDNKGIYFYSERSKNVYLVQEDTVNMFFTDILDMFPKVLSTSMTTDEIVESVNISGTFADYEITIGPTDNIANNSTYIIEAPYRELCSYDALSSFGSVIFGMTAETVIAVEVSEDELSEYGLDEPYMDIEVVGDIGNSAHILVSEQDENGSFYIMKYGATIVYQMSVDDVTWYNLTYRDFLDESVINPNMDYITEIDISTEDESYRYDFIRTTTLNDNYEEIVNTEVQYNNEEVLYTNISLFVNNVASITRGSELPESIDDCTEIFSITYTFEDEDNDITMSDTMKLYKTSDDLIIVVLNDITEGYTDAEYVQKVIDQLTGLYGSDTIEDLTESDDESSEAGEDEESDESSTSESSE